MTIGFYRPVQLNLPGDWCKLSDKLYENLN